jgi:predicted Zn-dependent protease
MWNRSARGSLRRQLRTARALYDEGAYEEAEALLRHLIPDCDETFGADHRESISARNTLGSVLYQQHKLGASAAMHSDAMSRAARVLGPDDPATLDYAHNYGAALAVQGKRSEAVAILQDTLERRVRRLGDAHEDTLHTANTLGATLFTMGALPEGLTLLRQAHAASRRLPEGHPLRGEIADNLRVAQRNAGGW